MDPIDRFAAEATLFEEWARTGLGQGECAAREALVRVVRLYLAALELPPAWTEALADQPEPERVGADECQHIAKSLQRRLPFDLYGEVFDTLPIPPEMPVVGSLTDDLTDIYRDVVSGLREYGGGRIATAVWEWGFHLQIHWGEHATSAIRALHCWLAANAPDHLAAVAEPGSTKS
jgi:hypothetical protein